MASAVVIGLETTLLRCGAGLTLSTVSVGTTGLLHVLTKPYVTAMSVDEEKDPEDPKYLRVSTLSVLGGDSSQHIPLSEIQSVTSLHPFAVFQAQGRVYHVDHETVDDLHVANRLLEVVPTRSDAETGR